VSEPEPEPQGEDSAAPAHESARPTPESRPPSTTIGAGTALAIGCVVALILFMAAVFLFLPRVR
jgi:hypothetical protein